MANDILTAYLLKKYRGQDPNAGAFDVNVSNSTAPAAGAMPPPEPGAFQPPPLSTADLPINQPDPITNAGPPPSPDLSATPPQTAPEAPMPTPAAQTPAPAPLAPPPPISGPSAPAPAGLANAAPPPVDPLAGFGPADRAKVEGSEGTTGRELAGEVFAGLGDAISKSAGGSGGHLQHTIATVKEQQEKPMEEFDKKRAQAIQNYDVARKVIENNRGDATQADLMNAASPISKSNQALLDKLEPGVDHSKINALQAEVIAKPLLERYKIDESSKNRKMMTEYMMDKKDEETGTKFEQEMNASKARAGALGDNMKRLNASERVLNLIEQVKGNPNAMQTPEVAQAVASLVGGGGGVVSQQQIEHLMPQSMKGNANKFIGWLTNDPRGLGQQEFIKSFMHTAERERDLINRQMVLAQAKSASGYMDWAKRNPASARAKMEAQGVPDAMIQKVLSGDFKGLDAIAPTSAPPLPKMPVHDDANLPSFASEAEAEAAKLPKGTMIKIGDRRARID